MIPADAPLADGAGLDVGSTTAKIVVARAGAVVYRAYRRHHGAGAAVARELVDEAAAAAGRSSRLLVTGSAATALAGQLAGVYVHEVHAVAAAARARYPRARTVVDLGGQDAKMIHLAEAPAAGFSSDMNERCAAGTGATLDRCLYRMGLDCRALETLSVDDDPLPPVSAKCGVFAETDLVSHLKAGVPPGRVLLGLLDGLVRANLAVLAHGRPLPPQVLLLGGPHAFVPALAELWRRHLLARWSDRGIAASRDDDVVVPPDAAFFAAEGAVRCAPEIERLADARSAGTGGAAPQRRLTLARAAAQRKVGPGLLEPREDMEAALRPHRIETRPARTTSGRLALGIDAGSTTIKVVALDERDELVARLYRRSEQGPLQDVQAALVALRAQIPRLETRVVSLGVTGYAADVLAPVLGADARPVETVAHAHAARRWVADTDVVCDVGGQDIKVLLLDRDGIRGFRLSSQCAAGNGVLLEATARDLGVPLERYAEVALQASRSPELSVGCAVFLDTERVTCQRDGYTAAEILAGMARVLPRNVWENVAAAPLPSLGRTFVLSGGVQRNAAVLKAEIDYIRSHHPDARVIVHPYAGEAGAIGAALLGRHARGGGGTRFVGFDAVGLAAYSARNDDGTRCGRCPSRCPRTIITVDRDERRARLVAGHACERGESFDDAAAEPAPRAPQAGVSRGRDLLRIEAQRLFRRAGPVKVASDAGAALRVAIPRVLCMYRSAPFFIHYLEAIGVPRGGIVTGEPTSEALWRRAAGRGTVDACFPAKVVQAHVADLLANRPSRPFDVLFYPILTHAVTAVGGCADTASCPVVAGSPLVTRAAFGADGEGRLDASGTRILTPVLVLTRPELLERQLFEAFRAVAPGLTLEAHRLALAEARAGQRAFERSLEELGAAAIARARRERRAAIVLLARPYHVDPGLHHDLGSELAALGRTCLSIRALPKSGAALDALGGPARLDLAAEAPFLTNSGDGEKLAAARMVAAEPWLVAIDLSSFKCGQDASLYHSVAGTARGAGKPFLALHDLDETRPVGSLRLRLRTFLDSIERYESTLALERGSTCSPAG